MRVCLVSEGSYPYVAGGVAGWIHMLCSEFSDIEFVIWSIATTKKDMHKYKYTLPPNVKEVKTVYIGEEFHYPKKKKVKLKPEDKEILKMLMTASANEISWAKVIDFIGRNQNRLLQIILGIDFYDNCLEIYQEKGIVSVFKDFLWNMRGMYLPLMNALTGEIPEADIYHSVSTGYAGVLASCASHSKGKPMILSEHGIYTREREEDIIRSSVVAGAYKDIWIDFFNKLSSVAYFQAKIVTSLFETNRTLQEELRCPSEKIVVIPNGIDYQRFYRPVKEHAPKEWFDIGTVLRIVPIKDVKTMIVAFCQVKEQVPNARLHILGNFDEDAEYYEECVSLIHNFGLRDVIFYGQVDVNKYIENFDILLLTSISEGQPLAVLEGMAAGKPFVCTNVGNCRELLEGNGDEFGPAGFIVPVMNGEKIAEHIVKFAKNPGLITAMGENGQKRVEKYYRKEMFLEKFRNMYETIGVE